MENMEQKEVEYWKDLENTEENTCSEKIWEKNMEENSGRKVNWIVKWYGKYGRK
jgi:hypothetical protein